MRRYHNADADPRSTSDAILNEQLLDWRINPGDKVIVIGGYRGEVCDYMLERYPACELFTFEPQTSLADEMAERYADEPNVHVGAYALGVRSGHFPMTGALTTSNTFMVRPGDADGLMGEMFEWDYALRGQGVEEVAFLHCNIEGYEYVLLPHLIESGAVKRIRQMVIATHWNVPNWTEAWQQIVASLSATHRLMWESHPPSGLHAWHAFERIDA